MTIAAQVLIFALSCFQSKLDTILKLSFVDPSGQPIQVTVDQQGSEPIAGGKSAPNFRETSVDGKIDIITDKRTEDRYCFVYAKGYAIDLLNISISKSRSMRVRMQPADDISVLIVDKDGKPISNARVAPGQMIFRRSAWIANIPDQLPSELISRTNIDGRAMMRGAIASDLQTVRVTMENGRSCTFQIPGKWDRTSELRIVWNVSFGTLVCRLLDPAGMPVAGAKVYATTNGEVVNALVIEEPTAEFTSFMGKTDDNGCVAIPNVPATTIDVRVFSPASSIGRGEYKRFIAIQPGKTNTLEFRQKPLSKCLVSVVDVTDGKIPEGLAINFSLNDRVDRIYGETLADEVGICEVEVQPGEWSFTVSDSSLPDDYCIYYPERSTKFRVVQSEELQSAPPIFIGKGQVIQGKIIGIDLSEIRFDWIIASSKDGDQWMGQFDDNGEFRIVVPNHVDLSTISEFSIGDLGKGVFTIESKSPWLLKWSLQEQP